MLGQIEREMGHVQKNEVGPFTPYTHMAFHFVTGDIWTHSSFIHIPDIAILNIHVSVSMPMCKSFSVECIST